MSASACGVMSVDSEIAVVPGDISEINGITTELPLATRLMSLATG